MQIDTLSKLCVEELKDLYNAEKQILKALPKMMKAASHPELKDAFRKHLAQTEIHVERLESVFEEFGKQPAGKKCKAMEGLIAEGAELIEEGPEPDVMDVGLISSAQRVEHYEMAAYGCLRTYCKALGMDNTTFADASGLNQRNMSTASDLARMVGAAYGYEVIRQVSTTASYIVETDNYRPTQYRNSNALISNKDWDIGLSKTGFIREAGHCLVMQAQISTRNLIIILLDGRGKMTRVGDANRIKKWLEYTQTKNNQVS